MKIIVTCGPSFEPIDEVRRLTNFSTGELGVTITNHLTHLGHEVTCLKGTQATFPERVRAETVLHFKTTDDLARMLQDFSQLTVDVIFHAAALSDFKVAEVRDAENRPLVSKKIPTTHREILLRLVPTAKVLPQLRGWFPKARIVGWKYEAEGAMDEAIDKGFAQIESARTDACVVNGPAYGPGYGFCAKGGLHKQIEAGAHTLARFLGEWVEK